MEYLSQLLGGTTGAAVPLLNYAYGGECCCMPVMTRIWLMRSCASNHARCHHRQCSHELGRARYRRANRSIPKPTRGARHKVPRRPIQYVSVCTASRKYVRAEAALLACAVTASTNSVSMIMQAYTHPGNPLYHNDAAAFTALTQSARALFTQLRWLVPAGAGTMAPDFLVLPIMPLDLTSRGQYLATSANEKVDVIRNFTRAYNQVMMEEAQKFATELGARGQVFTYDFPS